MWESANSGNPTHSLEWKCTDLGEYVLEIDEFTTGTNVYKGIFNGDVDFNKAATEAFNALGIDADNVETVISF